MTRKIRLEDRKEELLKLVEEKLTQRQIADRMFVSISTVERWLQKLNISTAVKICPYCNKKLYRGRCCSTGYENTSDPKIQSNLHPGHEERLIAHEERVSKEINQYKDED